jgi:hypothetical protein
LSRARRQFPAEDAYMESPMRRFSSLVLVSALVSLLACQTPTLNEIAQSCPLVSILAQASEVTKVRATPTPTSDDVILQAEILPVSADCDYTFGESEVSVDLTIPIVVRPGPIDDGPQTLTYFAAVIDPQGNMVSKRLFQRNVAAGGNAMGTYTESVSNTTIGLPANTLPYDFQMLVGFQLSDDEYRRNQAEPLLRP